MVARVALDGSIDTSTALGDAYSASNIRSVTSTNGIDLWTGGTSSTTGGVRYTTLGALTSTQLSTVVTNSRVVSIYAGQLYTSSAVLNFQGVSSVGLGTPTTSAQPITLLAGFPTAIGPSSYDYCFADAATLYVADDRSLAAGGGLQKWTYNGTAWTDYTANSLVAIPAGGTMCFECSATNARNFFSSERNGPRRIGHRVGGRAPRSHEDIRQHAA